MTDDEFMQALLTAPPIEGPRAGSSGVRFEGKTYMRTRDMDDDEWSACQVQFALLKTLRLGRGYDGA